MQAGKHSNTILYKLDRVKYLLLSCHHNTEKKAFLNMFWMIISVACWSFVGIRGYMCYFPKNEYTQ